MNGSSSWAAWPKREDIPMDWSLGVLIDMAWVYLPMCRPAIADEAARRFQLAIDTNSTLEPMSNFDILVQVVNPVVAHPVVKEGVDDERSTALVRFLRMALTYSGPGASIVRYDIHSYLLEWMMLPPHRQRFEAMDPELVRNIINIFGSDW